MTTLSLNDEQLRQIVAGAVLQALTPESRDALIAKAVSDLLVVAPKDNWGNKKETGMERAFSEACECVARDICTEEMRKPENVEKVRAVVQKALGGALTEKADEIGRNLANVIVQALSANLEKRSY